MLEKGSFRDPAGFVFYQNGRVFRAMDEKTWRTFSDVEASGVWNDMVRDGLVIPTRPVDVRETESIRNRFPGVSHVVEHERVPLVTYPYEWTLSMMADAALLVIRVQRALLEKGFSLKDASAFNILFRDARPVFIDVNSIERPARLDIWMAYSQFCRMFLYPMLAFVHKGVPFKNIFVADLDGMDVKQAFALFGRWRSMCPDLLIDVFAQHVFSGKRSRSVPALRSQLDRADTRADAQFFLLDRLARKIRGLVARYRPRGAWMCYERENTYAAEAQSEKGRFVADFLREHKPRTVLDLGCNQGSFSVMAAGAGARVVAVDADHDCVDALYRRAKAENLSITSMLVNLANPSPGLGFRNEERQAFMSRVKSEAVFALALLHHLLIVARLPLVAIRDLLADLTGEFLVIEFIEREDSMFQELLALREDFYGDLSTDGFLEIFSTRFSVLKRQALTGGHRHLFALRKS